MAYRIDPVGSGRMTWRGLVVAALAGLGVAPAFSQSPVGPPIRLVPLPAPEQEAPLPAPTPTPIQPPATPSPVTEAPPPAAPTSITPFAAAPFAPVPPRPPERLCTLFAAHVPSSGVAYQPGVDVHGKPVVPADLGPATDMSVRIELSVDLLKWMTADDSAMALPAGVGLDALVGVIEVVDGVVRLNGEPLTPAAEARLVRLCPGGDAPAR